MTADEIAIVLHRLDRIEATLQSLVTQGTLKDWYSVDEVAAILGKASYTVREWCRLGRIRAKKRTHARGPHPEWIIGHEELSRVQGEGLLPAR
jgi:Helix-turn-helix domain